MSKEESFEKSEKESEIVEFMGSIFEAMGCKKVEDPAIPTFLPLGVIPKKQRWGYKRGEKK